MPARSEHQKRAIAVAEAFKLSESDLAAFRAAKERMDEYTEKYNFLREAIIRVAAKKRVNAIFRGKLVAVIKEEERRRPDYEKVLLNLKGEKFIKRLIARTKPQIIKKVTVVESNGKE